MQYAMSYLPLSDIDRMYKIEARRLYQSLLFQTGSTFLKRSLAIPKTGVINREICKATICKSSQILVNKITVYKTFYFV